MKNHPALQLAFVALFIYMGGVLTASLATAGYYQHLLHTLSLPFPKVTFWNSVEWGLGVAVVLMLVERIVPGWSSTGITQFAAVLVLLGAPYLLGAAWSMVHQPASVQVLSTNLDSEEIAVFYKSEKGDDVGVVLDKTTHRLSDTFTEIFNRTGVVRSTRSVPFKSLKSS
jgi:hypothetical protein